MQETAATNEGLQPAQWRVRMVRWLLTCLLLVAGYWWAVRPDLRCSGNVILHGDANRLAVALTFDDGPDPLWTPLLAESLEHYGARGTFFLVGIDVERYPELTRRLSLAGHEVASHSMTHPQHPNLEDLPYRRVTEEVIGSTRLLNKLTGQPVVDFRPPGGGIGDDVLRVIGEQRQRLALWSCATGDYAEPPPAPGVILGRMITGLRPGAIMLQHARRNTVSAVEAFFARGYAGDYRYVTVQAMGQR